MSLIGSTYFGFAQITIHDFQNIELIVALSSTNATKMILWLKITLKVCKVVFEEDTHTKLNVLQLLIFSTLNWVIE